MTVTTARDPFAAAESRKEMSAMNRDECVSFERRGSLAIISLNRPERRNAVDAATSARLREAIDTLERDDALRVGILRGNGPVFCAGMDLDAVTNGEAREILFGPGGFCGLVRRERTKPLVASVHGAALAGGFELVLACDLVVAAGTSVLGLPESRVGLLAGAGGALRIGRILPKAVACELLLTGEPITARRAFELGLVNRLADDGALLDESVELAGKVAANAPLSVRHSLALERCARTRDERACWDANDRLLRELLDSPDAAEGVRAFAEKRAPVWKDDPGSEDRQGKGIRGRSE